MGSVLTLVLAGMYYYSLIESYESTDDAFIEADVTDLAPKIAGRIDEVLVDDNQQVKRGDLLVTIDPKDYDAALRQKQASLDSFKAQAAAVQATIQQQQAHLQTLESTQESDRATADADRANAINAATLFKRNQELFSRRVIAPQDLDRAKADADSMESTLNAALKKVAADEDQKREAEYQLKTFVALFRSVQAMIAETAASLESARLNRSYAEIRAPASGRITNRTVQTGNYVQVGQVLLSLVPNDVYVIANYKENQIGRIRSGQTVTIHIDSLPGQRFPGHVHSIQAGSGARFSLLPAENATGNYVKVVQRIPVKIVFDRIPQTGATVGPGESVIPTVKIQSFHYSIGQLIGIGAGTVLILCLINWWSSRRGRRQSQLAQAGSRDEGSGQIQRTKGDLTPDSASAPRPANGSPERPSVRDGQSPAGRP
jgi:membrane fusion protein, multidrug efflux system